MKPNAYYPNQIYSFMRIYPKTNYKYIRDSPFSPLVMKASKYSSILHQTRSNEAPIAIPATTSIGECIPRYNLPVSRSTR